MHIKNRPFFLSAFFAVLLSSFLDAACTPAGTPGDDNVSCTGVINSFQYLYGGSDTVMLNGVSDITYNNAYWLDESLGGNPVTDGNDTFIANNSRFSWVLGFGGDDRFEIYNSSFQNLYADTNPGHGVSQRGNDIIYIERSVSNGWILGGNDNDSITIKDSNISFVAAGYSDIYGFDYTPFDGNDTIILDHVDFGETNYYYTSRPGAVEGGKNDDEIRFINGGDGYNVTGGHGNDRIIVEDHMVFHACTFLNDRGNDVSCGIYGDEPYASEVDAITIALHGDDKVILNFGDISGIVVNGGHGSDLVEMHTSVILLGTTIDGGDDRSMVDGFVDRLVFEGWIGDINGSQLQNWETIVFNNVAEIGFLDAALMTGFETGTDSQTNLPYGLVLQNDSTLNIAHDFKVEGNVYNRAIIDMQKDGNLPSSTLRIANDYRGDHGVIVMNTVLNDASTSKSDVLVVQGNTSGTTILRINNAGGLGAQTPTGDNEGILIIEVHGNSDEYAFELEFPDPYAGEYVYELVQGSNGNWYLQSYEATPPPAVIDAVNDDYTSTPVNGLNGGVAGDVTTNDTLNGIAVTDSDITITVETDGGLTGVTIGADGRLNVPANTLAGTYTVTYKICENLNTTNCDTATATVVVAPAADTIVALKSSLIVESYSVHDAQLPAAGAGTTCSGPFTYVLQEDVKHGELILDTSNGSYSYIPDADYNGVDSFSYQITSDQCSNSSNIATVSISVDCAASQRSDSADIFGLFSMLLLVFITAMSGLYFISKEERGKT